ncbi:MAG: hypothetical protein Q9217_005943 [Psora testacea]
MLLGPGSYYGGVFVEMLRKLKNRTYVLILIDDLDDCKRNSGGEIVRCLDLLVRELLPSELYHVVPKIFMTGRRGEQVLDIISASQHFEVTVGDISSDLRSLIAKSVQKLAEQRPLDAKDYIKGADPKETCGIAMHPPEAEDQLAMIYIDILLQNRFLRYTGQWMPYQMPSKNVIRKGLDARPAFSYAAEHWVNHLACTSIPDPSLFSLATKLLETQEARDSLFRLNYFFRYSWRGCPWGASRLHLAYYFNLLWLVEYFFAQKYDPNQVAAAKATPLTWASEMGSWACTHKLLRAAAHPYQVEFDGWSPLHWTAANDHADLCSLLLKYRADVNAKDSHELNPLDWAIDRGHDTIVGTAGQEERGR